MLSSVDDDGEDRKKQRFQYLPHNGGEYHDPHKMMLMKKK